MKKPPFPGALLGVALIMSGALGAQTTLYWDANGATPGSGNTGGDWLGNNWNLNSDGTGATTAWVDGANAVFSAGTDGTGVWHVTLNSTIKTNSILWRTPFAGNGDWHNLEKGTNGALDITGGAIFDSSVLGHVPGNARDVNIIVPIIGSGGLTIKAHGDHLSDSGGGGGAEFRLYSANTFSGGLTITAGIVSFNDDSNLGDPSNVITLNGGGLQTTGASHLTTRDVLVGENGGTIRTYGNTTMTMTGRIANAPGVAETLLRRTDGGNLIIQGDGSGFAGILLGSAKMEFQRPNANWAQTDFISTRYFGGGFTFNGGGRATIRSVDTRADVIVENGTVLDIATGEITMFDGQLHWIKSEASSGANRGKLTTSSPSGLLNVTIGAEDIGLIGTSHRFMLPIIDDGAHPVTLVKKNNASIILYDHNTYSGGTIIEGGRIETQNVGSFGSGPVEVQEYAQAWLNSGIPYANDFTISGIGPDFAEMGALRFSKDSSITGTVTLASEEVALNAADFNDRGIVSGRLIDAGGIPRELVKSGFGTIVIDGDASEHTGPLTVLEGTLELNGTIGGDVRVDFGSAIAGNGKIAGKLRLGEGNFDFQDLILDSSKGALEAKDIIVNGLNLVHLNGAPTGAPMDVLRYTHTLTLQDSLDQHFDLEDASTYRGDPVWNDTGSAITLTIPAGDTLVWQGDDQSGDDTGRTWDLLTTANWSGPDGSTVFYNGDKIIFDDSGKTKNIIIPSGVELSPASIVFDVSAGQTYSITESGNAGFTGGMSLIKRGEGTVNLGGQNNAYTGPVVIEGGILRAVRWETLGNASSVTIFDGAQLDINSQNLGNAGIRKYDVFIAGNGPNGSGALVNDGAGAVNENAGILNLILTSDASVGGNTTGGRFDIGRVGGVTGSIQGNGHTLTKKGVNNVTLRAPATDIHFVVEGGSLKFENYDEASGPYPIMVNGGALMSYGARFFSNELNFASGTMLENDGGGWQTWGGPVHLNYGSGEPGMVTLSSRGGVLEVSGVMSGNSDVNMIGKNRLILSGANSNTYTGNTTILGNWEAFLDNAGNVVNGGDFELIMGKSGGALAVPGTLFLNSREQINKTWTEGGVTKSAAYTSKAFVSLTGDNQLNPGKVVRWGSNGDSRLELNGTTQTVAGIDNTGFQGASGGKFHSIQHHENGSVPALSNTSNLILNVAAGEEYSYNGRIREHGATALGSMGSNPTLKLNIVKNGPGVQNLKGTMLDFEGSTTVNEGILRIESDDSWSTHITVAAGATYQVHATAATGRFEHQARTLIDGAGTYRKTGPEPLSLGWANSCQVALSPGGLIHVAEGTVRLEYGVRTSFTNNKGDLQIDAGAIFDLWDNTINDATYPNAGLIVNALRGGGQIVRAHNVEGNMTVGVDNGSGNFAGSISNPQGTTNVIKVGTGTQTLSGVNTYTGNTTVNGGTLTLANTGSLKFAVKDSGSNRIHGSGAVQLNGTFVIDTTAVTAETGTWLLVDVNSLNESYGPNFSVAGFSNSGGVWTQQTGTSTWTYNQSTGVLKLSAGGSGYPTWIANYFPGVSDPSVVGPKADPDGDGISNAMEMVLGGNPAQGGDANLLPTIELVKNPSGLPAGDYILYTYRRTTAAVAAGLNVKMQASLDLLGWGTAENGKDGVVIMVDSNYPGFVPAATTPTDRVRVYAPKIVDRLFGRLLVELP